MNMKVAVIGPHDLVETVLQAGEVFPELSMFPAPYPHEQDTLNVVAGVRERADILLFTGPIPYQLALDSDPGLPMVHVHYSGTALYKVLFDFSGVGRRPLTRRSASASMCFKRKSWPNSSTSWA